MSLIGSRCKFQISKDSTRTGIVVEKYRGLTKGKHEGPQPSGGRGEYDSYFPEDYYIVQISDNYYQHISCDKFVSIETSEPIQIND